MTTGARKQPRRNTSVHAHNRARATAWRLAAWSLWLASCATSLRTNAADELPAREWQAVMRELDAACLDLDRWLLQEPRNNLNIVAGRAQAAADQVSLGYGKLDHPQVADFARMSRDCESWFLRIAIEARQGHGGIAADLYRTGRERHCVQCHDAFEASK